MQKLIEITPDNIYTYEAGIKQLRPDYIYYSNADITEYIYIYDNVTVAYALLKTSSLIYDIKDKYINKTNLRCIKIYKKFINDFRRDDITCLYNLIRLPDIKYAGAGISLINAILSIKKKIYLATIEKKLYSYYIKNGFKPTNYFDIDISGIFRKVLVKDIEQID